MCVPTSLTPAQNLIPEENQGVRRQIPLQEERVLSGLEGVQLPAAAALNAARHRPAKKEGGVNDIYGVSSVGGM